MVYMRVQFGDWSTMMNMRFLSRCHCNHKDIDCRCRRRELILHHPVVHVPEAV